MHLPQPPPPVKTVSIQDHITNKVPTGSSYRGEGGCTTQHKLTCAKGLAGGNVANRVLWLAITDPNHLGQEADGLSLGLELHSGAGIETGTRQGIVWPGPRRQRACTPQLQTASSSTETEKLTSSG